MLTEPIIKVGVITDGEPVLTPHPDGTRVENLLIGEGFHWQRRVSAVMQGRFEPLNPPQGNIRTVNILPVEQYIESVVASEMNPNAPLEFLKAHAVISRRLGAAQGHGPARRKPPRSSRTAISVSAGRSLMTIRGLTSAATTTASVIRAYLRNMRREHATPSGRHAELC